MHRLDDGPARANGFGDLRVTAEIQALLVGSRVLCLGDDPAAFAPRGDGHEGAVRQVKRPSQAPYQGQHPLVRIEPGLDERLAGLPKLLPVQPPG